MGTPINTERIHRLLLPGLSLDWFVIWPPDTFGLTSMLLHHSECFRKVVSPDQGMKWPPFPGWSETVRAAAQEWREALAGEDAPLVAALKQASAHTKQEPRRRTRPVPKGLIRAGEFARQQWRLLKTFLQASHWGHRDVRRLCEPSATRYRNALLTLHAIADEACRGLGLTHPQNFAELHALFRLNTHGTLATFHPDRGRVSPKVHSPTVGLSLRSFSQNVTFHRSPVKITWPSGGQLPLQRNDVHCLILPWPRRLDDKDFKIAKHDRLDFPTSQFKFFEVEPPDQGERALEADLEEALQRAEDTALAKIDLVILPELSLAQKHETILKRVLAKHRVSTYIAGLRVPREKGENFGHNRVVIRRLLSRSDEYTGGGHDKHNRWQLHSPQVIQYGLKDVLPLGETLWEAIRIPKRELAFFSLGQGLVVCPLICEDLARQDSIAEAVRAVGPSLLVPILMDGPQETFRWTGRYGGMHSEDPGSAVLSVTSYGMARRYLDVRRQEDASVGTEASVALWNCPRKTERICCDEGDIGAYLKLSWTLRQTVSADCRMNESSRQLSLESWEPVRQSRSSTA